MEQNIPKRRSSDPEEDSYLIFQNPHYEYLLNLPNEQFLFPLNQDSTNQYSLTEFPKSNHLRRSNSPQRNRRVRLVSIRILKPNNNSLSSSPHSSSEDYHSPKEEEKELESNPFFKKLDISMRSQQDIAKSFGEMEEWYSCTRSLIHPPEYTQLKDQPTYQWQINLSSEDILRKEYFPNEGVIIFSIQHRQYFSIFHQSQLQFEGLNLQTPNTIYSFPSSSDPSSHSEVFILQLSLFPSLETESKLNLSAPKVHVFSHVKLVMNNGIVSKLYLIETPQEDHKPMTLKRLFLDGDEFNERKIKKHKPNFLSDEILEEENLEE